MKNFVIFLINKVQIYLKTKQSEDLKDLIEKKK